jgi:RimJ/RimL family protein N-acetyltransferase
VGSLDGWRALGPADAGALLILLRRDPVRNVLLEYLVRCGALGRVPGFYGCAGPQGIDAVLLIGALGGAFLEARSAEPLCSIGPLTLELPVRPRHITGPEEWMPAFLEAYLPLARRVQWSRREPLYLLSRSGLRSQRSLSVRRAEEKDLDEIALNSAQQHIEDLKEDRAAFDPAGFRRRHMQDLRAGHWWIARERGRIVFQVHVGPENEEVVQLGGVFTPPELRRRGYASRALGSLAAQLLLRKPAVCLFCDEANLGARSVYETLGFRVVGHYRSVLLEA